MDYKKKYEEALGRASKLRVQNPFDNVSQMMEHIFPELKESEDERIRKELIFYLGDMPEDTELRNGVTNRDVLVWLEKQDFHYTFEIKKGYWYKCVCDYMLNGSDLMFKHDRLYYCGCDWRLQGEIDERNVKDIGVNGYKSFFRPATNQEIKDWLEKQETFYTKKDVDDAYLKGISDTKNEIEKQYEANYQIRKDIATFIFNCRGDIKDRAKWMNYLGIKVSFIERQEEKPQGKSALEAIKEEKADNANKIEPKFKVGDWVVFENKHQSTYQVEKIEDGYYILRHTHGGTFRICVLHDESLRLWTIQDAKDGDILASKKSSCVLIFKGRDASTAFSSYYNTSNDDNDDWSNDNFLPATKEQRELLFAKMKEDGYKWDVNNKQLIKL